MEKSNTIIHRNGNTRRNFLRSSAAISTVGYVGLAGCIGDDEEEITLQANTPGAEGEVAGDLPTWVGEIVEEETNGRIQIETFHDLELGGVIESMENVSAGSLDIYVNGHVLAAIFDPDIQIVDLPYGVVGDSPYEEILEKTDPTQSEVMGDIVDGLAENHDLRSLGAFAQGTRRLTVAGDPVFHPDDLSGRSIRAVTVPMYEEVVVGLGAEAVEMDFAEVHGAIAGGTVDGQENPYNIIVGAGIHEISDYVVETNHQHPALAFWINEGVWQDLSVDDQEIFLDAIQQVKQRGIEELEASIDRLRDDVRAADCEILSPDEIDTDAFVESVRSHIRSEFPELVEKGEELFDITYE